MPSIKDFENKAKKSDEAEELDLNPKKKKTGASRRRPGRDAASEETSDETSGAAEMDAAAASVDHSHEAVEVEVMDAEEMMAKIDAEEKASHEAKERGEIHESPFKKIHVHVPGTDVTLTFATPDKVVEIADSVVEDWKNDGSFQALPLGSPVAQMIAAKGLRKAKDIEKKLEEKGVFVMAQMGLDYIKSKMKK